MEAVYFNHIIGSLPLNLVVENASVLLTAHTTGFWITAVRERERGRERVRERERERERVGGSRVAQCEELSLIVIVYNYVQLLLSGIMWCLTYFDMNE